LSPASNFFWSPAKYCFLTSSTFFWICASVIFTPSLSASRAYSARWTRNATACVWSDWYSEVPALGNWRFCAAYVFFVRVSSPSSVAFWIGVPSTTATASDGTSSVSPQPAARTVSTARAAAASMSERFIRFLF
jgi:hypothetical protein